MSNYSKTVDTNFSAFIFAADIVRNMTLKKKIDLENNTFIKAILLDKWDKSGEAFQEFLSDNLMSGHMWAVAKK